MLLYNFCHVLLVHQRTHVAKMNWGGRNVLVKRLPASPLSSVWLTYCQIVCITLSRSIRDTKHNVCARHTRLSVFASSKILPEDGAVNRGAATEQPSHYTYISTYLLSSWNGVPHSTRRRFTTKTPSSRLAPSTCSLGCANV